MSAAASRKNILLIIPEMCVGGAQRSLANLSVELARDFNVWLVVFNKDKLAPYTLGGELLSLDVFSSNSVFTKVKAFFNRVAALKQLKQKLKIDASVSFLEGADYVNVLSRVNDKVIVSIRGSKYFDEEISGALGALRLSVLMPLLYRRADKIVCVSQGIMDELRHRMRLNSRTLMVIHNFYDRTQFFSNIESDNHTSEKFSKLFHYPILLSVGRLHRQKNYAALLEMFARVVAERNDVKLVIVGDGNERSMLVTRAKELKLIPYQDGDQLQPEVQQVFFTGFHKPGSFLKHARIFLLPSLWEGFPNSLMEALAFGVPSIAADCPTGPREILAPDTSAKTIDQVEYTQAGVLMPVLNSPERTKLWATEVVNLLHDEARATAYRVKGPERFNVFDTASIYPLWKELLSNTAMKK